MFHSFFRTRDPILYRLSRSVHIVPLHPVLPPQYFLTLVKQIINQQLSERVGDVICGRFIALFGATSIISPKDVLHLDSAVIRACGISGSKVGYIRNIAEAFSTGYLDPKELSKLSDEEVIASLVEIKGIGQWTAEMFLMFALARPDVFSAGDLGLKHAIEKYYHLINPSKQDMIKLSEQWKPHRTTASRILWQSL